MDTIFMNLENGRTSEYHVLGLKLTDKLDLRRGPKSVALSNISIYYTWKNIKSACNNSKLKIFVNNDYQQDSRILYMFVRNKPFGSLLEISPTNHIFLKAFNSDGSQNKLVSH